MLVAAAAMFLPAVHGAEADIYVTTGPDGIEIFSNLPRGPVAAPGKAASVTKSGTVAVALPSETLSSPLAEMSSGQGSEAEATGKSFLVDD